MPEVIYRGETTRQLYRFMFSAMPGLAPQAFGADGNLLPHFTYAGETLSWSGGIGIRDGSQPRGVIGSGFNLPSTGQYQDGIHFPTWNPSDWEQGAGPAPPAPPPSAPGTTGLPAALPASLPGPR